MEFIEQTYKSIIFYFVNYSVDQSIFNIVSKHSFQHHNVAIEFGILTESHFLSISAPNDVINEICACKSYDIKNAEIQSIENITNDSYQTNTKNFSYSFSSSIVNYRTGRKVLSTLRGKQRLSNTHYLTHTFPGKWPWSRAASTEIYVTVGDTIVTETVHTYPNENKMVFSQSEVTPL